MDLFAMVTSHEQQVKHKNLKMVKVTIFRSVLSRIYGTLCGPLEIPGGPPVVHLDHVENYWSRKLI